MTVHDAIISLVDFFCKNDVYHTEKDFLKLNIINGEDVKVNKALVLTALKQLAENKVVVELIHINSETVFVLQQGFSQNNQQISINGQLAATISILLNKYYQSLEIEPPRIDPLGITERDLIDLVNITLGLLKETNATE